MKVGQNMSAAQMGETLRPLPCYTAKYHTQNNVRFSVATPASSKTSEHRRILLKPTGDWSQKRNTKVAELRINEALLAAIDGRLICR